MTLCQTEKKNTVSSGNKKEALDRVNTLKSSKVTKRQKLFEMFPVLKKTSTRNLIRDGEARKVRL